MEQELFEGVLFDPYTQPDMQIASGRCILIYAPPIDLRASPSQQDDLCFWRIICFTSSGYIEMSNFAVWC